MTMRPVLIALVAVSALVGTPGSGGAQRSGSTQRPNIVLIISDDMGYGDLGSYGAPDAKTPNIDRIARDGVRFTNAYANGAVCTPTRAALITGRYQHRVGIERAFGGLAADTAGLRVTAASLPARLKQVGYATGLIGKWHLGVKPEFGPNAHGFDEFWGFLGGALDYYTHRDPLGAKRHDLYQDTVEVQSSRYLTDEITDKAVDFVGRRKGGPFFLEVAYNATHWPFEPPGLAPTSLQRFETILPGDTAGPTRADYVKMLERMDDGVGKILNALEAAGIARYTLVVFTNDNGGEWLSRNTPHTMGKGTLWEGGIRVPLLMRWPGRIPSGRVTGQVAVTMDLTATFLTAAGATTAPAFPLDGIDLIPTVAGGSRPVERELFWRMLNSTRVQRAVRMGPWKLLVDGELGMMGTAENVHIMLFDLRSDPSERKDLAAANPALVAKMLALYERWDREVPIRRR